MLLCLGMAAAEIQVIISIIGALDASGVLMAAKVARSPISTTPGTMMISDPVIVFKTPLKQTGLESVTQVFSMITALTHASHVFPDAQLVLTLTYLDV